jgi:hypothetical protein
MAYILNKTTGEVLINLVDGTADGPDINPGLNVSDIDLFGKNYPFYGQYLDENFIKLLQNFANATAPGNPLQGELWYDISNTANQVLRVFNGTSWLPVTPVWVANSAPVTTQVGAQWWDATNLQLNMYNGSGWTTVGPAYKATDGKSGSLVEDVVDTSNVTHTVIKFYTNENVSAIVSYDQSFTLSSSSAIAGFTVINPGITLSTRANILFYGTATNSQQLGNIIANNYARTDIDSVFSGNVVVGEGNLTISTNNGLGTATFINSVTGGNISFHANVSGTDTALLNINGNSGEVTVAANPITSLGVVTKQYSDNSIAVAIAPLATLASPALTGIPTAPNAAAGDNSSQISTTSFVQTTMATANSALWLGSQKTVSNTTPTSGIGKPGDFWFQI